MEVRIDGARATLVGRGDRLDVRAASPVALLRLRTAGKRFARARATLRRIGPRVRLVVFGIPVARI